MANTEKIFVDLNEDIVFVLEKIQNSSAPRVILVIPKSANLTSSLISLKILTKQLLKTKKLVTLVTEDNLGMRLGEKAGMVVTETVGEITNETWEKVKEVQEKMQSEQEKTKRSLLGQREDKSTGVSSYEIVDDAPTVEIDKVDEEKKEKTLDDYKSVGEDEEIQISEKPRIPAKVITLSGIKFFAGADIVENEELLDELMPENKKSEILQPEETKEKERLKDKTGEEPVEDTSEIIKETDNKVTEKVKKPEPEVIGDDYVPEDPGEDNISDEEVEEEQTPRRRTKLIGTNLANVMPNARPRRIFGASGQGGGSSMGGSIDGLLNSVKNFLGSGNKSKIILAAVGIIILYFLYSFVAKSSVSVKVTLKKATVSISETVKSDPAVTEVQLETLTVPGVIRSEENDASENATATGQGTGGEYAKGQVTIYNFQSSQVSIPAGTILEIQPSGLQYKTNQAVTIDAGKIGDNVAITAASPGQNYNSDADKWFKVTGFDYSETGVKAKTFYPVTGGTSKQTTVVSEQDLTTVKDVLKKRVESTATSTLESLAGTDEIMVPDTITVEVLEETTTKQVGEETDKFDVSIKAKVSALFVQKSDIEAVVTHLVDEDQNIEGESEVIISEFPDISNVTFADNKATFTITAKASARAKITSDTIRENIQGKSLGAANEYLKSQADIDKYTLSYSPSFVPGFLKKVPSGDRLKITVGK